MTAAETPAYSQALRDFQEARLREALGPLITRLYTKAADGLSDESIRQQVRSARKKRTLINLPVVAIVGSGAGYPDLAEAFLGAENGASNARLTGAAAVAEAYQIGDGFYLLWSGDQQIAVPEADSILAGVEPLSIPGLLATLDSLEDLIIQAEYALFLNRTRLDEMRPKARLALTEPGGFRLLEEHIAVQRLHLMGLSHSEVSYGEAVGRWYDEVYVSFIQALASPKEVRLLQEVELLSKTAPARTETDLYLWFTEHRTALLRKVGAGPAGAAPGVGAPVRPSGQRTGVVARLGGRLRGLLPGALDAGPAAGDWRRDRSKSGGGARLFGETLVPIRGDRQSWQAFDQAAAIARREDGSVHGLHVVREVGDLRSPQALAVWEEFERRRLAAGVTGRLDLAVGDVTRVIGEQAATADLLLMRLDHPPGVRRLERLDSGFRNLIRRSSLPVLAVPGRQSEFRSALLAYDGSPKATEGLYVAAYMAGRWGTALSVLVVEQEGVDTGGVMAGARSYLESQRVAASYTVESGDEAEAIMRVAAFIGADLIVVGGYGATPVVEVMMGSVVDEVLRRAWLPVLVAR